MVTCKEDLLSRHHLSFAVFLTNTSPAKCHIHTINRLPNLGDYGKALFRHQTQQEVEALQR